jgi:hypothetical protein
MVRKRGLPDWAYYTIAVALTLPTLAAGSCLGATHGLYTGLLDCLRRAVAAWICLRSR